MLRHILSCDRIKPQFQQVHSCLFGQNTSCKAMVKGAPGFDMKSEFGKRLLSVRRQRNMSQQQFAELLCTSKQVVSRYETGKRIPKITTVQKYADLLHLPLGYFLEGTNGTRPYETVSLVSPHDQSITIVGKNGRVKTYACTPEMAENVARVIELILGQFEGKHENISGNGDE